jgi:hypothetical protein
MGWKRSHVRIVSPRPTFLPSHFAVWCASRRAGKVARSNRVAPTNFSPFYSAVWCASRRAGKVARSNRVAPTNFSPLFFAVWCASRRAGKVARSNRVAPTSFSPFYSAVWCASRRAGKVVPFESCRPDQLFSFLFRSLVRVPACREGRPVQIGIAPTNSLSHPLLISGAVWSRVPACRDRRALASRSPAELRFCEPHA